MDSIERKALATTALSGNVIRDAKTKALIGTPSFIDDCFFRIIECHLDARGSLPRVSGTSPVT